MEQSVKQRIADIQRGNIPTGYRKTKCGIIPDKWSCCQSKEIFFGKSIKNNAPELPVLSVTQENGVMLRSEMDKDISYKEDSVSSYKRVDIGDFVISLRSFEGGIEYSQCKGVVSPAYTIFSHSEDVNGSFYKYYFKTDFFINKLNTAVYGIRDGKQIGFQDFSNLFIHCPPLEEQRRIAEILGCCDRVIALKKELIAEKKKQKKALMQKLLNPNSGFRLPGFSGEWKKTTIGESGTFAKGKGIQNSQCTSVGFPCVKYGDIYMKYNISFNAAQSFTSKSVFSESLQITSGALLFTCSGEDPLEIGKCVLYSGSDYIAVGGDIIVMHPNESISPDFLVHQQYSDDLIKQKSALGKGNSIVHIHLPEIKSLKISLPPTIKEQQAIADILSAADKEIDLLEQELAQQEQKKKSLMQLLLTGIVRV